MKLNSTLNIVALALMLVGIVYQATVLILSGDWNQLRIFSMGGALFSLAIYFISKTKK